MNVIGGSTGAVGRTVVTPLGLVPSGPNTDPVLSSPKILVEKHGFRVNATMASGKSGCGQDWSNFTTNMEEPDQLRSLAIVAVGDGCTDDEHQCLFVNREYLAAWNPTLAEGLIKNKDTVQEVAFPGSKEDLDNLVKCIWPGGDDEWPLTIKQLTTALISCSEWGMHWSLVSAISFHLHSNSAVPAIDKLKLASRCGSRLLLTGSLHFQCRRETVHDIVSRAPDDFEQIKCSKHAALVLGDMLEHAAKDGVEDYKEVLLDTIKRETGQLKEQFRQLMDFSQPQAPSDAMLVISNPTSGADPEHYYVNRAYLACWSPVFRAMFFGSLADGHGNSVTLRVDDGEHKYWRLFLTLIHPCHMCSFWRLLPREYCYSSNGRGVSTSCREWLDSAFSIIFDEDGVDALMHVFRLAHKFQVYPLINFCVLMVEAKSDLSLADKILLADTYHLPILMEWCVGKLTTARSVKRMFSENEQLLASLSCNTHKILLERMLELV